MYVTEMISEASAALFVSGLQPSNAPTTAEVLGAIDELLQRLGPEQCWSAVASEFGDHPQEASRRMQWTHRIVAQACGRSDPARDLTAGLTPGPDRRMAKR